jgi:glyceraldehyde 3-phosphate dehydrogenase
MDLLIGAGTADASTPGAPLTGRLHSSSFLDETMEGHAAPAVKIGINGFGRIGRLVFRALWGRPGIEVVHVNDAGGDARTAAHLLAFDSVHGRWPQAVQANTRGFFVAEKPISYTQEKDPTAVPWREAGIEMVLECSGKIKTPDTLQPYFDAVGLKRVLVACPVKGVVAGAEALNVVFGINHLD